MGASLAGIAVTNDLSVFVDALGLAEGAAEGAKIGDVECQDPGTRVCLSARDPSYDAARHERRRTPERWKNCRSGTRRQRLSFRRKW